MPDTKIGAVIFDMDGTLLNTLPDIANSINRVLERHGFPVHSDDAYKSMVGSGMRVLVQRAITAGGADEVAKGLLDEIVADVAAEYAAAPAACTTFYDGIRSLLDALTRCGIPMAILSNKPDHLTQLVASELLGAWEFRRILGQLDSLPKKPDPSMALEIAQEMGVTPPKVLFLGDSDIDMITARRAGMFAAGAEWGFRGADELRAAGAHLVAHHPTEIESLVAGSLEVPNEGGSMSATTDMELIRKRAAEYIAGETDTKFRQEVEQLLDAGDEAELTDRFYTDLAFGTGGLRGVIGGGFNRMNPLVVQSATEGLARYVEKHGVATDGQKRAVIAHDSRRYSVEFALQAALVFAAHGIKAYLFSSLRPTPELSYSVRYLKATVGIVVTASHNPPQYNGYKVYWADGAQIVEPHDTGIIKEVRGVGGKPQRISKEEALEKGLLEYIDAELDDAFVAMVKAQSIRPELLRDRGKDLKVVYTPLHGTGAMMVERVLGDLGIEVISVPEQREPDGEFPTVKFPNPEEASALKMALDLGASEHADIVMGTDPDADRLGIAVPDGGEFRLITGNQHGVLLVDYIFSSLKETGKLPADPVFVKTIVTTEMQRVVAQHYGARVYDVLTGFKHIATVIRNLEENPGTGSYVTGGEESYGFLIGTEVRDKDAISATLLTAEMALYHLSQGKSVMDRLRELYAQFGYYQETQISRYFEGSSGRAVMDGLMTGLRENPPREIGSVPVVVMRDYQAGTTKEVATQAVKKDIDLPASNVLQFALSDDTIVSVRPSGTEPKIKFYASVTSVPGTQMDDAIASGGARIRAIETWIDAQISRAG